MMENTLIMALHQDLRRKLSNIKAACTEIWDNQEMKHYTRHGIEHSENIIRILSLLLHDMSTMKVKLSEHELFILLASAYLHDIGMQSAYHADIPDKAEYSFKDLDTIRENHHVASFKMIFESIDSKAERSVHCGLQDCREPNYVTFIARLSKSHRMNRPGIMAKELEDDYLITGEIIRVRLLVALLRLGDELDRDYTRVKIERLKLWDIPLNSKVHWWIHHYTRAIGIQDGIICPYFRIPLKIVCGVKQKIYDY